MVKSDPENRRLYEERVEASKKEDIVDLYDLDKWEPRTLLDRLCLAFSLGSRALMLIGFLIALAVLVGVVAASFVLYPVAGFFMTVSIVPSSLVVWYVWETKPYEKVPAKLVTFTFLLGFVLVAVPLAVNTATFPYFVPLTGGIALFFFVVVAPVEETVKWLAVRLYGYGDDSFDTAADGAVLGAVAGLGFATAENAVYMMSGSLLGMGVGVGLEGVPHKMSVVRAGAAPLHVIWSAIAGYYLALAKLNREHAAPIIFKGLLIAVFLHGAYNVSVTYLPYIADALHASYPSVSSTVGGVEAVLTVVFLLGFYVAVGYYPYRKINRYRKYKIRQHRAKDLRTEMEMSQKEVDDFLQSHGVGVLALAQEDESYAIPMSYGYEPDTRLLCVMLAYGPLSKKREWVRNTEKATFVVYDLHDSLEAESVIIEGTIDEMTDEDVEAGYDVLSNNALFTVLHVSGASAENTDFGMYRFEIESVTGRKFEHELESLVEPED